MPKGLSEEELDSIERSLRELRHAIAAGDFFEAERVLRRPGLEAAAMSGLITEVRRLRTLVKDVAPYLGDEARARAHGPKGEREIRQLQARLRAEVDRQ